MITKFRFSNLCHHNLQVLLQSMISTAGVEAGNMEISRKRVKWPFSAITVSAGLMLLAKGMAGQVIWQKRSHFIVILRTVHHIVIVSFSHKLDVLNGKGP